MVREECGEGCGGMQGRSCGRLGGQWGGNLRLGCNSAAGFGAQNVIFGGFPVIKTGAFWLKLINFGQKRSSFCEF